MIPLRRQSSFFLLGGVLAGLLSGAAITRGQAPAPETAASAPVAQPVVVTLEEAIRRAQSSDPAFAGAQATGQSAALDRSIARADLLPSVRLFSQDIYTRPNGIYNEGDAGQSSAPLPSFVANDSRP